MSDAIVARRSFTSKWKYKAKRAEDIDHQIQVLKLMFFDVSFGLFIRSNNIGIYMDISIIVIIMIAIDRYESVIIGLLYHKH
jgi:hypothetical protein